MRDQRGSASAVALVVVLPLLMVVCLGLSWMGNVAAKKAQCEEAARAVARELATRPEIYSTYSNWWSMDDIDYIVYQAVGGSGATVGFAIGNVCVGSGISKRTDGYAYAKVTYNYRVPIPTFWKRASSAGTPIWAGAGTAQAATIRIVGEALFKVVD